jgi:hypothetical protein
VASFNVLRCLDALNPRYVPHLLGFCGAQMRSEIPNPASFPSRSNSCLSQLPERSAYRGAVLSSIHTGSRYTVEHCHHATSTT